MKRLSHHLIGAEQGSVIMFSDNGEETCRWNFYRAFPLKWEGPTMNATR